LLDISLDNNAQDAMARMFSSEQTACIHFQILGETEELDQCIDVGLWEVNLWESLQGTGDEANDMLQTELVVKELGADQGHIGKLHIIIEGIKMLHQILSNLDCLQHK
jgi:hypothetical protein